ncbi:hypothetical protein O9G_003436 [Rozella allomycis CSF55]|uniref:Uncharacterized protein n=1 Tax=Rozella allomycis (strain CSF55) TaxID=988480 RepID=A0A075B1P3_ROZAC|nr:hypothetical protein O9G_003436 [Rozella allomycis CSF55]|eukprot:EPZ36278.1 hypothetical protein O9G_003436 [Rozella allomycis CSF55]
MLHSITPLNISLDAELKIKSHVKLLRRRPADFFKDFDKLNSGCISASQFNRGLAAVMEKGPGLSNEEVNSIMKRYCSPKTGLINYQKFARDFDGQSIENLDLSVPSEQHGTETGYSGLSKEAAVKMQPTFGKIHQWIKHHGANLKSWFRDFDRHHNGYVTIGQFLRSLPQNLFTEKESQELLKLYLDEKRGQVNYFRLDLDMNNSHERMTHEYRAVHSKGQHHKNAHVPIGTENILLEEDELPEQIDSVYVEDKIRKIVYKRRIRILEFCRDYDKLNSNLITTHQFASALHMAGLELHPEEVNVLCQAYNKNGRVMYRKFCDNIDTIFTKAHLEYSPLSEPEIPSREFLQQLHIHDSLTPEEEKRFDEIIKDLRKQIEKRRISVGSFFADFDKGQGHTGRITKSHLSRILSMLSLEIAEDDLFILFKKYEDHCGDVTYHEFLRLIEGNHDQLPSIPKQPEKTHSDTTEIDLDKLLNQLKHYVYKQRIRVQEFFVDCDRLRHNSILHDEFIRGIGRMGFPLNSNEAKALVEKYKDKSHPESCKWKEFAQEMDSVFSDNVAANIHEFHQQALFTLSEEEKAHVNSAMAKIHETLRRRPVILKPFFRDFDKSNNGHVSVSQARQSLMYGKIILSEEEFNALRKVHEDCDGFDYLSFLSTINTDQKRVQIPYLKSPMYPEKRRSENRNNRITFDYVMNKLKSRVKTERFSFREIMKDFDPLRHGKIHRHDFQRALRVFHHAYPNTQEKLDILTLPYTQEGGFVDYVKFCNDLESVFTIDNLEQNPLAEPPAFVANLRDPPYELDDKENAILDSCSKRLATQLSQRRMDLYFVFEDYDRINNGTITQNQFVSVLCNNNLKISQEEAQVLLKRFSIHQRPDSFIDYIDFNEYITKLQEKLENEHE